MPLGMGFQTFRKIVVPSSSRLSLLEICLEGLRKTTKFLHRKIRYARQDSDRAPSECRSDSLPPEPSFSVFQCCSRLVPVISNHCTFARLNDAIETTISQYLVNPSEHHSWTDSLAPPLLACHVITWEVNCGKDQVPAILPAGCVRSMFQ